MHDQQICLACKQATFLQQLIKKDISMPNIVDESIIRCNFLIIENKYYSLLSLELFYSISYMLKL